MTMCTWLLGASFVPPRCLPGASLVPPRCLLVPLDLVPAPSVDTKNPRGFSFKFTMCPVPPPKMPPKPPMLLHNPSSARFSDPEIHQKCLLVTHTRCKGGDSFHFWLPFFHFIGGMEAQVVPTSFHCPVPTTHVIIIPTPPCPLSHVILLHTSLLPLPT